MNNLEKYEGVLNSVSRESGKAAWSSGIWTFFFIILIFIILTVVIRLFVPFANMLEMLFILIAEGIILFIPLGLYFHKASKYMQERCLELEKTHPGILNAYDEWKQKIKESSLSN